MPAAQLEQSKQQLAAVEAHIAQAVDEYKSAYPLSLKFDYSFHANEAPFDIEAIYHDDKFTYIKTDAPEKFSVYEMRDGKPNLDHLRTEQRHLHHPQGDGFGIRRAGQEAHGIHAQRMNGGEYAGTDCQFYEPAAGRARAAPRGAEPKGVLQKNLKPMLYLGAAVLVIVAAIFSGTGEEDACQKGANPHQPPQPMLQDSTDNNVQDLKNQVAAAQQKAAQQAGIGPHRSRTRKWDARAAGRGCRLRPNGSADPLRSRPAVRSNRADTRSNNFLRRSRRHSNSPPKTVN